MLLRVTDPRSVPFGGSKLRPGCADVWNVNCDLRTRSLASAPVFSLCIRRSGFVTTFMEGRR